MNGKDENDEIHKLKGILKGGYIIQKNNDVIKQSRDDSFAKGINYYCKKALFLSF